MSDLPNNQATFVEAYLATGGDVEKAATTAGYSPKHGYKLMRAEKVRAAIDKAFEQARISAGPRLWDQLMKLAFHAGKESTRLDAIKAAMDRSGLVPGRKVEIDNRHSLDDMSLPQLYERLAGALSQLPPERRALLAGRLTPVDGPATDQPIDVEATEPVTDTEVSETTPNTLAEPEAAEATPVSDADPAGEAEHGQDGGSEPTASIDDSGGHAPLHNSPALGTAAEVRRQLKALGIEPDGDADTLEHDAEDGSSPS